jgi:hypothetical protein
MKKTILSVFVLLFIGVSCTKEDETSTSETNNQTTQTQTWVKLTALTSSNVPKPNYIVMMFDQPVTSSSVLPLIKKQVTTDANGLAYFDLNTMITSDIATTYYFEAFVQDGQNYIWKSITHPTFSLKKGTMGTSSIIVN